MISRTRKERTKEWMMKREETGLNYLGNWVTLNKTESLAVVGLMGRGLERIKQIDSLSKKESEALDNRSCQQLRVDTSLR